MFITFFPYYSIKNKKYWIDSKLKWDPKLYDGIKTIHIPIEKLWKPDIVLSN